MKLTKLILGLTISVSSFQALSWGQTGHRITGAIAEQYLTANAQAAVSALLPNEDLAEASTYADEMRSDPSEFWRKTASPWHYVNVHDGHSYHIENAPSEGDAVTALEMFSKQLVSSKGSRQEKQLALRFIVHIIGDLHQPLHSGTDIDQGGNKIKVNFFWEDSNLHRVWDSQLIDRQKLSYSEWTERLTKKITKQQAKEWMVTDPAIWIKESTEVRKTLYPQDTKLSWDYQYQHLPAVKQRLQMGGVRIAAYLNQLFK
ncbi:S1/P1 nuclease [Paraglaciecola aquimarina]|uniref:S1/P1 nuclease n=1 Tax=Paraglaciecola aquimarina TaxID=1235557 RepID=A0ABU3SSZ4_9ALTE|nr:S1/P1 nuclease [Paraglaciecola aquimarina]MDU0353135.1 S1/P1 nuclease [Paraglaciecola aquimarina]